MSISNFRRATAAIAITSITLFAGFTSAHLTGCQKRAPAAPAAPSFTKADVAGTWRLAPGSEYAVARAMIRTSEKKNDVTFTSSSVAEATDELIEFFKKNTPVLTLAADGQYSLKYGDRRSSGTWTIEDGRVLMLTLKGARTILDYTDGTLDSRDEDSTIPSFRFLKD